MKKILSCLLLCAMLTGCGKNTAAEVTQPEQITQPVTTTAPAETTGQPSGDGYVSIYDQTHVIRLSDTDMQVDAPGVYLSHDIIYYEDKDTYESGNPYGEGQDHERHSTQEATEHTVVNITQPGAYELTGTLSKGQIRIDLGEDAYDDPHQVVELILSDAHITCTVAPAILFLNVYECDGAWSVDTAKAEVDTSAAGARLILQGENTVTGSHVAKIFRDQEEEKKLCKQDGAVYSYMSMNVYGPGKLDITADNEGLDTELHLSINGGELAIRSQDDGINTNEDGVSVTTINAGTVHIIAGLGAEGDGIDSNGYLVINGGTVVASANPGADAGMDADLGSYIHGGTVIALGSCMDWAESDSGQVTMNLQFAQNQSSDAAVVVTDPAGQVVFAYDPGEDEVLAENRRVYSGAVISCASFTKGESYHVYVDGTLTGEETGGVYDTASQIGYTDGMQMAYTGTDVRMQPGGMGFGGGHGQTEGMTPPEGFTGERPHMPDGQQPTVAEGEMPALPQGMTEGQPPAKPEGMTGGEMPAMPEDMEQFVPGQNGQIPQTGDGEAQIDLQEGNTLFYMQDKVNFFSGLHEKDALT